MEMSAGGELISEFKIEDGEAYEWTFDPSLEGVGEHQSEFTVPHKSEQTTQPESPPLNSLESSSGELLLDGSNALDFEQEQVIEEMEVPPPQFWDEIGIISEPTVESQPWASSDMAECPIFGVKTEHVNGEVAIPTTSPGNSAELTQNNGTGSNGGHFQPRRGERVKSYQCKSCPKKYCQSGSLNRHVLSKHVGDEGTHKCPTCLKAFWSAGQLQSHIRTHTGNYPNTCPTCKKGFLNQSSLKVHINTHTGEKPFKCPNCELSFTQSGTLNRHIRSRHVRQES